jgi:hypothetical protein
MVNAIVPLIAKLKIYSKKKTRVFSSQIGLALMPICLRTLR